MSRPSAELAETQQDTIANDALAFRVWREAKSVGWDCTVDDMAAATREDPAVIRDLCAARRWQLVEATDDQDADDFV